MLLVFIATYLYPKDLNEQQDNQLHAFHSNTAAFIFLDHAASHFSDVALHVRAM